MDTFSGSMCAKAHVGQDWTNTKPARVRNRATRSFTLRVCAWTPATPSKRILAAVQRRENADCLREAATNGR